MAARVLVAYATKYGSTREIAERIGATLRDAGLDADVADAATVHDVAQFDAVILGSALYAATWRRDATRFARRHQEALLARPVWSFSSGPLDRSADSGDVPVGPHVARVVEAIGVREHRTFGGKLLPDTPGMDPQILATHPTGDFRDWDAITGWAIAIARTVEALRAAPGL